MIDPILQYLACPNCGDGLHRVDGALGCGRGHRFDLARQGYVSLLGPRSRTDTGDTAAMVAAREAFLAAGHYRPIAAAVAAACPAGARAIRDVAAARGTAAPWYASAPEPDRQLMRDLGRAGHVARTTTAARVHSGAVLTVGGLAGRRARSGWSGRLVAAVATRLALLALAVATVAAGWALWPWAVGAALAVAAGAGLALRRPHRTVADVVAGALLVPAEVDLWLRVRGAATRA